MGPFAAGKTDEVSVVELDDAFHFLVIAEAHANGDALVAEVLQVLHLFEGLFRSFRVAYLAGHDESARVNSIIASAGRRPQILALQLDAHGVKPGDHFRLIGRRWTPWSRAARVVGKHVLGP